MNPINQYIWTIFRSKSFKLRVIDKIFSLPFKISSFLSFQLLGDVKLALLMGAFSWYELYSMRSSRQRLTIQNRLLFIGGLTPAATLSIIPASRPQTTSGRIPVPDYLSGSWAQTESLQTDDTINPTTQMMKLASETALNMAVIPPAASSPNSSFHVQFYGPTVQCNDSSAAESLAFNHFTQGCAREVLTYTKSTFNATDGNPTDGNLDGFLIFSAFSPTIKIIGEEYITGRPNQYNNWEAEILPLNYSNGLPQQIWIQTATRSIVCSLVNASFSVDFEFSNGHGAVRSQIIEILPPTGASNTTALDINPDNTALDTNVTDITNAVIIHP
jgi:hypothetical protein